MRLSSRALPSRRPIGRLVVAVLASLALLLPAVAHADDTPASVPADFTVANVSPSAFDVSFGTPRSHITHWRVATSISRALRQRRTEYLLPVTWSGVRLPHAAVSGDGEFTFVTVRPEVVPGAQTAKQLGAQVGSAGLLTQPQAQTSGFTEATANVRWIMPTPPVPPANAPRVNVATFNIRDNYYNDKGAKNWTKRRKHVASDVRSADTGVLMLQESAGPARYRKRGGKNWRQFQDLRKMLGRSWGAVFDTEYETGGKKAGKGKKGKKRRGFRYNQQGVRILYRKDRYQLVGRGWEAMPHRNRKHRFPTPYAVLRDRASGAEFVAISVHLAVGKDQAAWNLRQKQVSWAANYATRVGGGRPVVLAGDMNTAGQNDRALDAQEVLAANGFADAASAQVRRNLNYPTVGGFDKTPMRDSWPNRIDSIHVLNGVGGAYAYTNHVRFRNQPIASDHYMQSATLPLRVG